MIERPGEIGGEARRIDLGEQIHTVALRPATIPESVLTTKENRALSLDGKQAYVMASARSFAIPDGPFTVEAWVAPAADGTTGVVAGNFDFLLYLLGGLLCHRFHLLSQRFV